MNKITEKNNSEKSLWMLIEIFLIILNWEKNAFRRLLLKSLIEFIEKILSLEHWLFMVEIIPSLILGEISYIQNSQKQRIIWLSNKLLLSWGNSLVRAENSKSKSIKLGLCMILCMMSTEDMQIGPMQPVGTKAVFLNSETQKRPLLNYNTVIVVIELLFT